MDRDTEDFICVCVGIIIGLFITFIVDFMVEVL